MIQKLFLSSSLLKMTHERFEKFYFLVTKRLPMMNFLMLWRVLLGDFGDFGLKGRNTNHVS